VARSKAPRKLPPHAQRYFPAQRTDCDRSTVQISPLGPGNCCNTVVNPRSINAGSILIWAELEEGEEADCEYIFIIHFTAIGFLRGEMAIGLDLWPLNGENFHVSIVGNKPNTKTRSKMFAKEGDLGAVACLAKGEKTQILDSSLRLVGRGRENVATATLETKVTSILKNGPCEKK